MGVFPEPSVTAFRRHKTLKGLLVRARSTNNNNYDERVVFGVKSPDVECVNLWLIVIVFIPM